MCYLILELCARLLVATSVFSWLHFCGRVWLIVRRMFRGAEGILVVTSARLFEFCWVDIVMYSEFSMLVVFTDIHHVAH